MDPVKFNLFWSVKLKISAKGFAYLNENTSPGAYNPDESGYITIKLWEFLRVFGPTVKAGRSQMFDEIMYLVPPGYRETETIRVRF